MYFVIKYNKNIQYMRVLVSCVYSYAYNIVKRLPYYALGKCRQDVYEHIGNQFS